MKSMSTKQKTPNRKMSFLSSMWKFCCRICLEDPIVMRDLSSVEDYNSDVDFKLCTIIADEDPEEICCPISFEIYKDPVRATDGHTYERKCIETWFRLHDTSPWTGLKLSDKSLTKDVRMRRRVDTFHKLRSKFAWV